MNVSAQLHAAARLRPTRTALVGVDRRLTHEALDEMATGVARRMLADGFKRGDRVAIHASNSVDAVIMLLACIHAGLVAVPVNVRFKPAEILHVVDHCRPKAFFADTAVPEPLLARLAAAKEPPLQWTSLPAPVDGADLPAPPAESPVLLMYASASSARPRGSTHTVHTLMASAETMFGLGHDETTVALVAMPITHAAGLTGTLLPALLQGGTAVLLPEFDPAQLLETIARRRCTWTLVAPALMPAVAAEQERQPRDVHTMKSWVAGGDPIAPGLSERWERLTGQPLVEGYAKSESLVIAYNPRQAIRRGSIGKPAKWVQIAILDEELLAVAPGAIGQIAVRSPANFIGYWNDPRATAEAYAGGWLLTGDLGRIDAAGYLWYEGRLKEMRAAGAAAPGD